MLIGSSIFLACVLTPTFQTEREDFFAHLLLEKYGLDGTRSADQLREIVIAVKASVSTLQPAADGPLVSQPSVGNQDLHCNISSNDFSIKVKTCLKNKCLTPEEILAYHSVPNGSTLDAVKLRELSPTLLYQAQKHECGLPRLRLAEKTSTTKPTSLEVWGYGILFVSITNVCALLGVLLVPFMTKFFYKNLLTFMVALAVGTLSGSALFFLIPDALGVGDHDEDGHYIWKGLVVLSGIYLFFIIEFVLSTITEAKEKKTPKHAPYENIATVTSVQTHTCDNVEVILRLKVPPSLSGTDHISNSTSGVSLAMEDGNVNDDQGLDNPALSNSTSTLDQEDYNKPACARQYSIESEATARGQQAPIKDEKKENSEKKKDAEIAPVAWMIIFGDAVHNLIDGLSMGAAFTESIYLGISVSVAVICEELPHELGDFAILLNAGMTKWKAVGYNFLSACTCYLGLILGILVSEATAANEWVFALAGGMFLYISLADMMPEMKHATSREHGLGKGKLKTFFIQNVGLWTGFGIMLILALYGGNISFE